MGLDSCRISRDSTEYDATWQRVGQEHRCNNRLTLMRRFLGLFVGLQMVLIEYHMSLSCNTPLWPDQSQTQICKGFVCLQLLDEHGHPRDFAPAKDWWNITGQSAHKWAAWIKTDENPCLMASLNSSDTKWHHCRVDRLCGFTIYHIITYFGVTVSICVELENPIWLHTACC